MQGSTRHNRGRPLVGIGAREHEGACVDREAAETADGGANGGGGRRINPQNTVDIDDTGTRNRTTRSHGEGLPSKDIHAAVICERTRQGHVTAPENIHRAEPADPARPRKVIGPIKGQSGPTDDSDTAERPTLSDFEDTRSDYRPRLRARTRQDEFARPDLEDHQGAGGAIDKGTAEGIGACGDGDRQA